MYNIIVYKYYLHCYYSADISKMRDYQKRCNGFFMDLVAQLCFAQNTPPTDEVIDKLLGMYKSNRPNKNRNVAVDTL